MQNTSELYQDLLADPRHRKEHKVFIAGEEYGEDRVISLSTSGGLFEQDSVCIGSAVSREIDLIVRDPGSIPRGAKLCPWYRLVLGERVSEWIPRGTFYIDTRETNRANGVLTIHGFDGVMRAERVWTPDQALKFPMPMDEAAAVIAGLLGTELDPRTRLRSDYFVGYPTDDYTLRDVLRFIAAAHGGNWTMTEAGKLRLVRLRDLQPETSLLVTKMGQYITMGGVRILVGPAVEAADTATGSDKVYVGRRAASVQSSAGFDPISKIIVNVDDENYFEAGNDSGQTLEATCPYGTQAMANDLLAELGGYAYQPLQAQDALIDPAAELGDGVTVDGLYILLAQMDTTFDGLMPSDIGAPGQREIESEIGAYVGQITREINRKIAETRSSITKTAEEIRLEVANEMRGLSASIDVKLDSITQQVQGIDGQVSSITQTVSDIITKVSGLDGQYSSLEQTVDSITSTVSGLAGQYSSLELTVSGITATVGGLSGQMSTIDQKIDNISLSVTGSLGGTASIQLSSGGSKSGTLDLSEVRSAFASDESSITISAGTVTFDSGTFLVDSDNLKISNDDGTVTSIADDGTTTATLRKGALYCSTNDRDVGRVGYEWWNTTSWQAGLSFTLREDGSYMSWGTANTTFMLYANKSLRENGYTYAANRLYLTGDAMCMRDLYFGSYSDSESGYIRSPTDGSIWVYPNGVFGVYPFRNSYGVRKMSVSCDLDIGNYSILTGSDERLKTNIRDPDVSALDVINKVQLYQFDWIESGRHENIGFIAQQLEAEAEPSMVRADKETGIYGISKMDFIPYLVKAVQELYGMVKGTPNIRTMAGVNKWRPSIPYEDKLAFIAEIAAQRAELHKGSEKNHLIGPEVI